jgi:hypothetical protein
MSKEKLTKLSLTAVILVLLCAKAWTILSSLQQ